MIFTASRMLILVDEVVKPLHLRIISVITKLQEVSRGILGQAWFLLVHVVVYSRSLCHCFESQ